MAKEGNEKEYTGLVDHLKMVNNSLDIENMLKDMENPVISPNPFEICDLDCVNKNKPELCNNCFFNYPLKDVFMKDYIDDYF